MKVLATIAVSAAVVAADEATTVPNFGRKLGQTKTMLGHKLGMSDTDAKDALKSYGCYCYAFGSNTVGPHFNYNGEPLDELDALCKKLYRAQKCVAIDNEAGVYEKECTITNAYQWVLDDNNKVSCTDPTKKNPNQCKVNMCELENDFTDKVAALFASGWTRNDNLYKWTEDEYKLNCPHFDNNNGNSSELKCCGKAAERKTYNSLVNTCCNDQISSIGSC
jgi:hypothetical protein